MILYPKNIEKDKLHCWNLSDCHSENVLLGEDIGYIELDNNFLIDLGYYDSYVVKVFIICEYNEDGINRDMAEEINPMINCSRDTPEEALEVFEELYEYYTDIKLKC